MIVNQAFRYELAPNVGQGEGLARHAGTARFAYNWALNLCRACLDAKERLPGGMTLHRLWNRWKGDNAPALNLERLVAGSSPETQSARGVDVRPA